MLLMALPLSSVQLRRFDVESSNDGTGRQQRGNIELQTGNNCTRWHVRKVGIEAGQTPGATTGRVCH
jgi:hypothetical protein